MKAIFFTIIILLTTGCFEELFSFKSSAPKNNIEKLISEIGTLRDLGWNDYEIEGYYILTNMDGWYFFQKYSAKSNSFLNLERTAKNFKERF